MLFCGVGKWSETTTPTFVWLFFFILYHFFLMVIPEIFLDLPDHGFIPKNTLPAIIIRVWIMQIGIACLCVTLNIQCITGYNDSCPAKSCILSKKRPTFYKVHLRYVNLWAEVYLMVGVVETDHSTNSTQSWPWNMMLLMNFLHPLCKQRCEKVPEKQDAIQESLYPVIIFK